jgi:hypothetical protein
MVNCRDIQFTPINGRTVRLTGDLSKCEAEQIQDVIIGLTCKFDDCEYEIKIGGTIRPRHKSPYRVNLIRPGHGALRNNIVCYDLSVDRLTDSSIFVLPFMGMNRKLMMWDSLFVNAFMATPEEPECIALLYRFSGESIFTKFESALCSFRNFKRRIDPDPYHVLFVFDIPEEAKSSYAAFKEGRYSEIDDDWKLRILEFHGFDFDGHTGKILFRDPRLRQDLEQKLDVQLPADAELHSKPNLEAETFSPEFYSPSKSVI